MQLRECVFSIQLQLSKNLTTKSEMTVTAKLTFVSGPTSIVRLDMQRIGCDSFQA